jgi:hypothetical protein
VNRTILAASCLLIALPACSRDPLAPAKKKVRETYQEEAAVLLALVPTKTVTLPPLRGQNDQIQVEGGVLSIPKADSVTDTKHGKKAAIGPITATIITKRNKPSFSSLPVAWGKDDLEKYLYVSQTSGRDIDGATTKEQLEDVIIRLTAKNVMAPLDMTAGLTRIEAATFSGALSGDVPGKKRARLFFRPKAGEEVYYRIDFKCDEGTTAADLETLLSGISFTPSSGS